MNDNADAQVNFVSAGIVVLVVEDEATFRLMIIDARIDGLVVISSRGAAAMAND